MRRLVALCLLAFAGSVSAQEADWIFRNAKVLTVDAKFSIASAIAIQGEKILAVGSDAEVMKTRGEKTKVIDAQGRCILPGLYDSHTHPTGAAMSEVNEEIPYLTNLDDVFAYIRKKVQTQPEGEWIVLRYAFPTRLAEARFPTKAELDAVAPKHPVLYHAGPAGVVNSKALSVSKIDKDTPNPANGVIVRDPKTGEATGMLRNAYGVLKNVPGEKAGKIDRRTALKNLFKMYNEHGITSIADRAGSRGDLDLYRSLRKADELTLRINCSRSFSPYGSREEIAKRLEQLPGDDTLGGPTGVGDEWVRIGPIKFFLDGGMLNGTAFMRQPWPPGETYQIIENDYRGLLFTSLEQTKILAGEAAKRKWSVTAHCAGEGGMDVLLDAYEYVDRTTPIKDLRFCITHANFPSAQNLKRCEQLGVCADVQPAWLYKDGATLHKVLGGERVRWFQPYKSWLRHTVIGGGSDHMIKLDPRKATNPWDPWLAIEVCLTRETEKGLVLNPEEALSREEALRLYTINNAYLHREEKVKGSLEPGKLADLIVIDRDYLTCPTEEVSQIRVQTTMVGGRVVFERKQ
jgi:predicted amidohydrolase YtcJ